MPAFSTNLLLLLRRPALLRGRGKRDIYTRVHSSPDMLDAFEWPEDASYEALGEAIASARGLKLRLRPIPEGMGHSELSGLTTVVGNTAHVFFDPALSPVNREQTILHEYAHILHGDVRADSECTHARTMFDDPMETRAEATGMRLFEALRRRHSTSDTSYCGDLVSFFAGAEDVVVH